MTEEPTGYSATPDTSTPAATVPDNTAASPASPSLDNGTGGQPTLTQNEWDNLPKAWKRDYEPEWKTLPEKVRQYVHTRESDVEKGIRTYADGHGRWTKAIEPFQEIFAQHPDLNPVELFQGLASNHLALQQASPAERKEMFKRLASHYGVDFAEAAAGPAGAQAAGQDGFTPAQLKALQDMLNPIVGTVQQTAAFAQAEKTKEIAKAVDAFWSAPENKYIGEVADDVIQIIKSGTTRDLKVAYEVAVMRNPAVKAKFLQDLATQGQPAGSVPQVRNVKNSAAPASPGAPATMDDTLKLVAQKHYKR